MSDSGFPLDGLKGSLDSNDENFIGKIYDFFPGIIYVYNMDSKKLGYVNKKITDVLGFSFDDLKSWDNDFSKVIFKDDVELVHQELEKFRELKDEQSYSYQCRFNRKDGDWMHFQVLGKILKRDEIGKPTSLLLVAQDINDQIRSAEELRAVRELAEDNEELLHFGNWRWNIKSDALIWSKGMYALMDFNLEETAPKMTMKAYRGFMLAPDNQELTRTFEKALSSRETEIEFKYTILSHRQREKIFHSKGKIIYDKENSPTEMVGTTRDITLLRRYEIELEQKISELDHSNRELEDFAYAASHDLQEPLRKISTLSDRFQSKYNEILPEDGKKYLERIRLATKSSQSLIDSLMEFSRITHATLSIEETDLNVLVDEVKADLELKIEETHSVIKTDKLPVLEVSPLQIKQLFGNIFLNSIKFRKPDIEPEIIVESRNLDLSEVETYHLDLKVPYCLITVRDNGIGFEDSYATRIFQMFSRLHGKAEYPGAGIGLALCKKIVENHKGKIFAEGMLGEGATFSIILPGRKSK